jgi:hypothetical protein
VAAAHIVEFHWVCSSALAVATGKMSVPFLAAFHVCYVFSEEEKLKQQLLTQQ